MNNWILPHIREEIAQLDKEREQRQTKQEQIKKPINYVILDAALWASDINSAFDLCPTYVSLFATRGAERDLDDVAPYLFSYQTNSKYIFIRNLIILSCIINYRKKPCC